MDAAARRPMLAWVFALSGCASLSGLTGGDDSGRPPLDAGHDASRTDATDQKDTGADRGDDAVDVGDGPREATVRPDAQDAACFVIDASFGPTMSCPLVEAGVCAPLPLPDASFPWHPPGQILAACTNSQVFGLVNDCLGAASTNAECGAFLDSDGGLACADCTISSTTSTRYGPLIGTGGVVTLNTAGCFVLEDPCSEPCGIAYESAFQCQIASCFPGCVGDAGSLTDQQLNLLASCEVSASSCACSPENVAMTACQPALMSNPKTAACIFPDPVGFDQRAESLISLFCGNGTLDAGSP